MYDWEQLSSILAAFAQPFMFDAGNYPVFRLSRGMEGLWYELYELHDLYELYEGMLISEPLMRLKVERSGQW